jgi:hypothetical protein
VLVTFFDAGARQPFHDGIATSQSAQQHEQQKDKLTQSAASNSDFKIWGDSIPQWAMAVLSLAGTLVSVLAVKWVRDTLIATRKANEIARESAERQLRAYVQIYDVDGEVESVSGDTQSAFRIRATWINTGQTPTRKLCWHLDYDIAKGNLPQEHERGTMTGGSGAATIGPGQKSLDISILVPSNRLGLVKTREMNLHVWGSVEYNDVFLDTERHRTEFSVWLEVFGDNTDSNFSFLTHTHDNKHNGADEECMHPAGSIPEIA